MSVDEATRTFVSSVVFVDLVGYSKQPVTEQITLKERFNATLADTLGSIPPPGRIILDTGDGAAISFLNDPEDALFTAMSLRRASEAMASQIGGGRVRIGVNMGPVRLGTDLNGHPSIVGDGIRVAEQIMSFAPPGGVTASRSFYELMSRLSAAYVNLFNFEGSRTDKHVRDHDVYTIADSDTAFAEARQGVLVRAGIVPGPGSAEDKEPRADAGALVAFLSDGPKVGFAALVLTGLAVTLGMLLVQKHSAPVTAPIAAVTSPAIEPTPQTEPGIVPSKPTIAAPQPSPAPAQPKPLAAVPTAAAPAKGPEPRASVSAQPASKAASTSTTEAPPSRPERPSPATSKPTTREPVAEPRLPETAKPLPTAPKDAAPTPAPEKPKREESLTKESPKPASPRRSETTKAGKATTPLVEPVAPSPPPELKVEPAPTLAPAPPPAPVAVVPLAPISRTAVEFPIDAFRAGVNKGTVKARTIIDASGNVERVVILSSRPMRVFDRAVEEALITWKFPPGAAKRAYEVEIEFAR